MPKLRNIIPMPKPRNLILCFILGLGITILIMTCIDIPDTFNVNPEWPDTGIFSDDTCSLPDLENGELELSYYTQENQNCITIYVYTQVQNSEDYLDVYYDSCDNLGTICTVIEDVEDCQTLDFSLSIDYSQLEEE